MMGTLVIGGMALLAAGSESAQQKALGPGASAEVTARWHVIELNSSARKAVFINVHPPLPSGAVAFQLRTVGSNRTAPAVVDLSESFIVDCNTDKTKSAAVIT